MSRVESALRDMSCLDDAARQRSWLHRIDPRAKVIATVAYVVVIASFPAHAVVELIPFASFPLLLLLVSRLPLRALTRPLFLAAALAGTVGLANPFLDRAPVPIAAGVSIAGGWLSLISILARALLGVTGALGLVATTGIDRLCHGLAQLGVPRILVTQLLFLYRYVFLLGANSQAMARARDLRSHGRRLDLRVYGSLVGHLLLRTLDRAERIHAAMCCRGFHGDIPLGDDVRFRWPDMVFVLFWCAGFALLRAWGVTATA